MLRFLKNLKVQQNQVSSNELDCKMVVVEMNALKRKCDEKENQLCVLKKRAKELTQKKNNFNIRDFNCFNLLVLNFLNTIIIRKHLYYFYGKLSFSS